MTRGPIDVAQLPPASAYLNYPGPTGVPVGTYLGPTAMGEWVTVVSNERAERNADDDPARPTIGRRVGVAYGCYTVNGEATDPRGLPQEVALAKMQADFRALLPPMVAHHRAGLPKRIRPLHE